MTLETIDTSNAAANMAAVIRHQRDISALAEEAAIRDALIKLGWTPPGVEHVTLTTTAKPSTLSEAVQLLQDWYRVHEDIFSQCASNPVRNAWGKEVNMLRFNEATRETQRFLRSIGELPR